MELHTGGSGPRRESVVRSESHRINRTATAQDKIPFVRPSSAGGGRIKGRFLEMKKGTDGVGSIHCLTGTDRKVKIFEM